MTCSCGNAEDHIIARRATSDGKHVLLWSDGLITGAMGYHIKGIGRARSGYEQERDVEAGWLAMGEVCVYDYAEIAGLVKAARKAVRQQMDAPLNAIRMYLQGYRIRAAKSGRTFRWVTA